MMLFRLAARSGRTVREIEAVMGCDELLEWHEYWKLEPFGCEAQQLAVLCSMFHSAHRPKGAAPESAERFLPTYDPDRPQGVDEIKAAFMQAFAMANATEKTVTHREERKLRDVPGMHLGTKLED